MHTCKDNNSVKRFRLSKSQNDIHCINNNCLELPKNNSILENNYHIENIPIIIPNYNKYKINNSTRHFNYSEHKTFDNNSINKINKRYYIEQDNKYLVENRLFFECYFKENI